MPALRLANRCKSLSADEALRVCSYADGLAAAMRLDVRQWIGLVGPDNGECHAGSIPVRHAACPRIRPGVAE